MKTVLATLMLSGLLVSLFAGCSDSDQSGGSSGSADGGSSASTAGAAVEAAEFRLAHDETPDSAVGLACVRFKELVEEASGGQMTVEIYDSGTLGSVDELFESAQVGNIDFVPLSTGAISTTIPDYGVFNMPYAFESMEQLHELFDGEMGDYLIQQAADMANLYVFPDTWTDGARHYFNNVREVTVPEDMSGLRIRVPDRSSYILPMEELGAVPVTMSINEAYLACSQGTVDGVEMAAAPALDNNIPDVCKYMCLDGHMITPKMFACNLDRYNSLSDAQKEIIENAAHEAALYQREISDQLTEEALQKLEEAGMIITEVDQQAFQEAVAPCLPELAESLSDEIMTLAGLQ